MLWLLAVTCVWPSITYAADQDERGRDFPKTLIFDEPGIDDEISLPTFIYAPQIAGEGRQTDVDFELDKRLTNSLSVQINIGYSRLRELAAPTRDGWQNADITLKYVAFANAADEQLVSLSLTRELGGTGASRIGAAADGATTAAVNIGQGFTTISPIPLLKPFAVTGSFGYLVPDETGRDAPQQALLNVSLQYSFDVLFAGAGAGRLSTLRPLIPIVEMSVTQPTSGDDPRRATLAPGLIYAGDGFQLAAEALVPLTRAAGHRIGAIAQLNISLRTLGIATLARPFF